MRVSSILLGVLLSATCFPESSSAQEPDQLSSPDLQDATPHFHLPGGTHHGKMPPKFGPGVAGIDSVVNFTGSFTAPGVDPTGKPQSVWAYSMVGNSPNSRGTTTINAPVIPVSVLLLDDSGSPRSVNGQLLYADASQYVKPALHSPVFSTYRYSSSEDPTQFTDAIQRAEFFRSAGDDWHTLLAPAIRQGRLLTLSKGTYRFALNSDGSCCSYILVDENTFGNALFPPTYPVDGSTIIGAAELAGDMTTKDITTLLLPNVFLYQHGDPKQCCVLGYHSYDYEPAATASGAPRAYIVAYASWITPGLFGAAFQDVTALSHELSETFNDPFVNNITPWWLAPNQNCQDDLETGDVIEGLPDATYPITLKGFTYHPQNEALLQYFEFKSHSDAINHAYSYPDTSVLSGPSAKQSASCK